MRRLSVLALALPAAALLAGCSTVPPQPTGRTGLIDYLGTLEPANTSGRTASRKEAREEADDDTGPGAVETTPSSPGEGKIEGLSLRWPLKQVEVTSGFGRRGSEFHEGVDLHAKTGTPVFAAQDGRVIYAGSKIRGYGRLIVIKHDHGISTVYAHNSKILVKHGDHVKLGQKIAISGKSGKVSGPHLHFEVRKGVAAVDPITVMPKVNLKASL